MSLPTEYQDSKGRAHVISEMAYTYLVNALNKRELMSMDSDEERAMIAALRAEKDKRDKAYAEQQAAEQAGQG